MLRKIITTWLVVVSSASYSNQVTQDVFTIRTIIQSIAVYADRQDFNALEKLYANPVVVDYTSLTTGEVQSKSPATLMTEWANTLPGFDITYHQISNIDVKINGKKAIATADVTADHYLDGNHWRVKGNYLYRLNLHDGHWLINEHRFNLEKEQGSRTLVKSAIKTAQVTPNNYILQQKTKQAVIDFLTSLEQKDMRKFASVWAEDAVQDMPYSPKGHPNRVEGKQAIVKLYSGWPEASGKADFTSDLVFYPMQNPEMIFVEYKGDVEIIPTERRYLQNYGGLFHVKNGQIKLFREYFDPRLFAKAFGLNE